MIEQFIVNNFGDIVLFLIGAFFMYLAHKQERAIVKKLEADQAKFKAEREAYRKKRAKVSAENMARLNELTDKIEAKLASMKPPAC